MIIDYEQPKKLTTQKNKLLPGCWPKRRDFFVSFLDEFSSAGHDRLITLTMEPLSALRRDNDNDTSGKLGHFKDVDKQFSSEVFKHFVTVAHFSCRRGLKG